MTITLVFYLLLNEAPLLFYCFIIIFTLYHYFLNQAFSLFYGFMTSFTLSFFYPVDWGCRIHRLHLCREVTTLQRMSWIAQSTGAVEYTDYTFAEG